MTTGAKASVKKKHKLYRIWRENTADGQAKQECKRAKQPGKMGVWKGGKTVWKDSRKELQEQPEIILVIHKIEAEDTDFCSWPRPRRRKQNRDRRRESWTF